MINKVDRKRNIRTVYFDEELRVKSKLEKTWKVSLKIYSRQT